MILLSGGSGVLGQELQKHMEFYSPSHKEFDITDSRNWLYSMKDIVSLIVHCAGYTDVLKAETDHELCYKTNGVGSRVYKKRTYRVKWRIKLSRRGCVVEPSAEKGQRRLLKNTTTTRDGSRVVSQTIYYIVED